MLDCFYVGGSPNFIDHMKEILKAIDERIAVLKLLQVGFVLKLDRNLSEQQEHRIFLISNRPFLFPLISLVDKAPQ